MGAIQVPANAVSQNGYTIVDINPGSGSSGPRNNSQFGEYTYFTADDGTHGRELWLTDGTEAGTQMVADICVGSGSAWTDGRLPANFFENDGFVYFTASPSCVSDIWALYRTEIGTTSVEQITLGTQASNSIYNWYNMSSDGDVYWRNSMYRTMAAIGNYVVFCMATNSASECEPYAFDTTTNVQNPMDGVYLLQATNTWTTDIVEFNGKVYWSAGGTLYGWDGTNPGQPVIDNVGNIKGFNFYSLGTELIYQRYLSDFSAENVWASLDTNMVSTDIQVGSSNFNLDGSVRFHRIDDNSVFFVTLGYSPMKQHLWKYSAGDGAITHIWQSCLDHQVMTQFASLHEFGGKYVSPDGCSGLISSTGTLEDGAVWNADGIVGNLTEVGNYLYGASPDFNYYYELYRFDSAGNRELAVAVNPTGTGSFPRYLTSPNDMVVFSGYTANNGEELIIFDPTFEPGPEISEPQVAATKVYFGPDSASLKKAARQTLRGLITSLPEGSVISNIAIEASFKKVFWSDKVGRVLAQKRAKAVKRFLVKLGVETEYTLTWLKSATSGKDKARNATVSITYTYPLNP